MAQEEMQSKVYS